MFEVVLVLLDNILDGTRIFPDSIGTFSVVEHFFNLNVHRIQFFLGPGPAFVLLDR